MDHVFSRQLLLGLFASVMGAGLIASPMAMAQGMGGAGEPADEITDEVTEDVQADTVTDNGQASMEKRMELARELLQLTKAREAAQAGMDQMLQMMRQQPGIPQEFFAEFERLIDLDVMMQQIAGVYAKHLSAEEMEAAIGFFSSPLGRSFAEKQPQILAESATIGEQLGEQWGMQAAQRIGLGQ